jgi:hypothetical protein
MTPPTNLRATTFGRRPPGMVIPTLLIREPVSSRKMAVGTAAEIPLQGFVSNSTPLYCNAENLVGIDGCFATILKICSYTCF